MRACQEAISSREFAGWKAYYQRNPFGPMRDDQRAGTIAAVLANLYRDRKKHKQPYTWQDFLRPQPREPQTWQQMLATVEMMNAAFGGDDQRPKAA